jgi:hypothetical protein
MSRIVNLTESDLKIEYEDRSEIRAVLLQTWRSEKPGDDSQTNQYKYRVETLENGSSIYLLRPAWLNKGCDFVIYCENYLKFKNGNSKPPQHRHLLKSIRQIAKALTDPELNAFEKAFQKVFECKKVDRVFSRLPPALRNIRVERLLKLAKWFFIEQDITYWTKSGRLMLYNAVTYTFCSVKKRRLNTGRKSS